MLQIENLYEKYQKNEFNDFEELKSSILFDIKMIDEMINPQKLLNKINETESIDEIKKHLDEFSKSVEIFITSEQKKTIIEKLNEAVKMDKKDEIINIVKEVLEILQGYGYPPPDKEKYGYPEPSNKKEEVACEKSENTIDETVNLIDVEIFKVGDYGAKGKYTIEDLEKIVKNFYSSEIKPRLKLGHFLKNTNIEAPKIGWVQELRIDKDKGVLKADVYGVPKEIADFIKTKGYEDFSVELFVEPIDNLEPPILKAVALLGESLPEVSGLSGAKIIYNSESKESKEISSKDISKESIQKDFELFWENNKTKLLPKNYDTVKSIYFSVYDNKDLLKAFENLVGSLKEAVSFEEEVKNNDITEDDFDKIEKLAKEKSISFVEAYEIYRVSKKSI